MAFGKILILTMAHCSKLWYINEGTVTDASCSLIGRYVFWTFFQLRIEFLVLSYQIRRSILVFPGQLFLYFQMMLIFFRNSYSFPYFKPFEKKFLPLRFRAPYFETFLLNHIFCKSWPLDFPVFLIWTTLKSFLYVGTK